MLWRNIEGFDAQSLIDSLPYYVMLVDEDHVIWMANTAIRRMVDVNPEDVVGEYCPKVIHGCDGPIPECPLEEAMHLGHDVEKEILDEATGVRVFSCIYDTGYLTPTGRRLYVHTVRVKDEPVR